MLIEKGEKTSKKKKRKLEQSLLRHSFCMSRHNFKQAKRTMSQLATKCHNKAQAELKAERVVMSRQSFYVATLLKKIVKKTVATMIKAERKGVVSRQYFLCRNIRTEN